MEWLCRKRWGSIEKSINSKIALYIATAAWCSGQHAGLRRVGWVCDAALGFDFMQFLMSISGRGRMVAII